MILSVGSQNITKIKAVEDAVKLYPSLFPKPEIKTLDVNVPLFGHPKSLEETVQGAIFRAKKAFIECTYSFGLEGGLMKVPHSKTGFMETGVCAVYDGKKVYLGLGSAFEWPEKVTKMILEDKADASKAFKLLGLTGHEKLGNVPGGILGWLTESKLTREQFTKESIILALISLEKHDLYS